METAWTSGVVSPEHPAPRLGATQAVAGSTRWQVPALAAQGQPGRFIWHSEPSYESLCPLPNGAAARECSIRLTARSILRRCRRTA